MESLPIPWPRNIWEKGVVGACPRTACSNFRIPGPRLVRWYIVRGCHDRRHIWARGSLVDGGYGVNYADITKNLSRPASPSLGALHSRYQIGNSFGVPQPRLPARKSSEFSWLGWACNNAINMPAWIPVALYQGQISHHITDRGFSQLWLKSRIYVEDERT